MGEEASSNAYTVVSIASGVYNLGKGAVTIVSQAKKFYTSVKGISTGADIAQDILSGANKLDVNSTQYCKSVLRLKCSI